MTVEEIVPARVPFPPMVHVMNPPPSRFGFDVLMVIPVTVASVIS